MATPLISGTVALLLNKYGNLSPDQVKEKLINACIDLKDSKNNQGSGLVNLQKLFNEDETEKIEDKKGLKRSGSSFLGKDILEELLSILLIYYLLDKNA